MNNVFLNNGVVQKTKVQIIRNLKNYKFPWRMSEQEVSSVNEQVLSAIYDGGFSEKDLKIIELSAISDAKRQMLFEKGYFSERILNDFRNRILLLSQDESVSIVLNDTDHIKIQVFNDGLDLQNVYRIADNIATIIETEIPIAFDERLGFLTANPADLGTAMKCSVILNLPVLEHSGEIPSLMESVSKIGLSLAPYTSSKLNNSLYVLSNTITLGINEDNAIGNLDAIARQLCFYEQG